MSAALSPAATPSIALFEIMQAVRDQLNSSRTLSSNQRYPAVDQADLRNLLPKFHYSKQPNTPPKQRHPSDEFSIDQRLSDSDNSEEDEDDCQVRNLLSRNRIGGIQ